jgi:ABC-type sugar transport system permease subunit
MLIFLSGLQSISPAIYEACQIEGATGWETFWKITFPMISPMILVNSVYTIIDSFTRTTNPAMKYATSMADPHQATAMSWIYFLLVMLIIAVVAGIASTFVFYQRRD